jgi:hypothetical protein
MKNIYALIFAAGLLMNSVDSVCSQEQDVYKVVGRRIVELAVFTGVAYFSYNFGRWAQNDSHDVSEKIKYEPMDLVVARFNLNKTDLDTTSELSMPRLELNPQGKLEFQDECARAIADVNVWSQKCNDRKVAFTGEKPVRSIRSVRALDGFDFKKSK